TGSAVPTLVAPRLEATPARACPAAASGAVEGAKWEETEDPMLLVAERLGDDLGRRAGGLGATAVSDVRPAGGWLRLEDLSDAGRALLLGLGRAALAPDAQGRRGDRAPAARGARRRPRHRADRGGAARRAHRGGRGPRGRRAARRRGPRRCSVLDRRLGPQQR